MSYLRPVKLQPARLEVAASQAWTRFLLSVLSKHKHFFSSRVCLRNIRARLESHLAATVPPVVEENLFHSGLELLRRDCGAADHSDPAVPDTFVLYMFVLYKPSFKQLEVPSLCSHQDRVTLLDLMYNVGAQHGHSLATVKLKMFEQPNISIEENYLTKRVLRGFHDLTNLVLWRAADDQMLQIIGLTCRQLQSIDLWKSVKVTDVGMEMLLGLASPAPARLCATLQRALIKDTSVTDAGAFELLVQCPALHSLEFSHGSFTAGFLARLEESAPATFPLRSIFLPAATARSLQAAVRALPHLEELSLWTALPRLPSLSRAELAEVRSLKLGGLQQPALLAQLATLIGSQLTTLKIETVHFDINIDTIGMLCPALEELSIINARVGITPPTEKQPFSTDEQFLRLRKLYFFLVQYPPVGVAEAGRAAPSVTDPARPEVAATGRTALHALLSRATALESVTVSGTTALTDSCLAAVLERNPLRELRRLVVSLPSSQESLLVIPLTLLSVLALHRSCPHLQCLGDLRHWAVSPAHRASLAGGATPPAQLAQHLYTRVQIRAAPRPGQLRTSSVCRQTLATPVQ